MVLVRILYAFIAVAGLGMLLGAGLAFASRFLSVRKDERIAALEAVLPGLNCGACGYAGCASYAAAIAGEEASLTLCAPGGEDAAKGISEIMEVEFNGTIEKKVPQVHCRGGQGRSEYEFDYFGIKDCNALYALLGGNKVCKFGCLGLDSCIQVCPAGAIDYDSESLIWVDKEVCIGCGKCVEVCPTGVMRWIPYSADYIVVCNSTDKGARVRKYCSVGCIACKICEKKSPEGGYKVEDFLSKIDYNTEGERKSGAEACPTKCIVRNDRHPKK